VIYIKIGEDLYPADINGKMKDNAWNDRESKEINLEMDYETAVNLFVDGLAWSIVQRYEVPVNEVIYKTNEDGEPMLDEYGAPIVEAVVPSATIQEDEFDNSEYCIAGDITDHRDGTISVKMGKLTELEKAYELMLGGIL
jgi:hypothetical protein